jgi:hypothetical protein
MTSAKGRILYRKNVTISDIALRDLDVKIEPDILPVLAFTFRLPCLKHHYLLSNNN